MSKDNVLNETKTPFRFQATKSPTIVESKDGKGRDIYLVEGIFAKVNLKNENNRRYPRSVYEKNFAEDASFTRRLRSRGVLGELEHPEGGNTHLERVALLITKVWMEALDEKRIKELKLSSDTQPGEYIFGVYEVLDTPKGKILRALHEAGADIGISSRGRGDIRTIDGIDEVQDDYELDTFDAVYLPSVTEAKPKPIRTEAETGTLGSALPSAPKSGSASSPATPPPPPATTDTPADTEWVREAEEVVRALEDMIGNDDADPGEMAALFNRALGVIDQLAALDHPDAIKLKSQALMGSRILGNRIAMRETGKAAKDAVGGKAKKESIKCKRLTEAEDRKSLQDGESVSIPSSDLLAALEGKDCDQANKIRDFLEKQDDPVMCRVQSKGAKGCVVHLVEPAYGGLPIFVEFSKVKKSTTTESKEDKMNEQSMIEELVRKNDQLTAGNAELRKKVKGTSGSKETVSKERYDAAKQLIKGLMDRCKSINQSLVRESARVKSAIKLIHKIKEDKKPKTETQKVATESVVPKTETPKVTEASKNLQKRLIAVKDDKGKTVESSTKVTESSNLMHATYQQKIKRG